jgi:hypothetical protein
MTIFASGGSRLFIGTTATPTIPADFDINDPAQVAALIAEFENDSYTEVGEVEDLGEIGDEAERITFTSLADSRVRKLKGPRDAGEQTVVVGDDMLDDGQVAMVLAEGSPLNFNFKIQANDARTLNGEPTTSYYFGQVFSKRKNIGNVSTVTRRNFIVGINSPIVETTPS